MKTLILGALALTFAVPAAAQPAQPQIHQGHDMSQYGAAGGQAMDHSQMGDCCDDADGNGKMDCCDHMAAAGERPCCAEHAQHQQGQQAAPAQPSNR